MNNWQITGYIIPFIMLIGFGILCYSTLYPKGYKYHKEFWAELDKK